MKLLKVGMNMDNKMMQTIPFFTSIDHNLLGSLLSSLQPLRVEQGAIIYRRGDVSDNSMPIKFSIFI